MIQTKDIGRNVNRIFQQEFRGINRKLRSAETEFSEAINLTSREYPALATRRERDYITDIGRCTSPSLCALGNDSVAYLSRDRDGHHICIDGRNVYTFPDSLTPPHNMVKMGAYLCVFPEGIVYNTADGTVKNIKASISTDTDELTLSPSKLDGKIAGISAEAPQKASVGDVWYNPEEKKTYLCTAVSDVWKRESSAIIYANQMDLAFATETPQYAVQVSSFSGGCAYGEEGTVFTFNGGSYINTGYTAPILTELPESAEDGDMVLINSAIERRSWLYQYRSNYPQWTAYPTSYVRIEAKNIDVSELFAVGDVIEISGFGYVRVYTSVSADDTSNGYIVVDQIDATGTYTVDNPIKISRNLPEGIANVFECANRLWAYSYDGREIYASKLGDPFNWYAFTGLASDSYAITVASGGSFTGGISYEGYPHFFKENSILKVYGNYPFRLFTIDCPGVAKESANSLAVLGGILVYKGYDGFYAYSGSYPTCISESIADISSSAYFVSAAASDNTAYYAAINHENGCAIYVYEKGIWHIHDAPDRPSDSSDPTVLDLCNTGRRIVAAFAAQDFETEVTESRIEYLPQTAYLVSLSGASSAEMSLGAVELYKAFYLKYSFYSGDFGEGYYFIREMDSKFNELKNGDRFVLNNAVYTVQGVYKIAGTTTTVIDVGEITDPALVENEEYQLYIYKDAPLKWHCTTAEYGISSPDDKYYSHFIFRYTAAEPVDVTVIYDDGHTEKTSLPERSILGSEVINVVPRRSDYVRLKLEGKGAFSLFSLCGNIEGGKNP